MHWGVFSLEKMYTGGTREKGEGKHRPQQALQCGGCGPRAGISCCQCHKYFFSVSCSVTFLLLLGEPVQILWAPCMFISIKPGWPRTSSGEGRGHSSNVRLSAWGGKLWRSDTEYGQGSCRTGTHGNAVPVLFYTTGTSFWHQLEKKRLKMRINDSRNKLKSYFH